MSALSLLACPLGGDGLLHPSFPLLATTSETRR